MPKIITSPHRYKERILAYGGAGTGKSSITLNMARYMPYAQFHVIDLDYSMTYDRLLATEYPDVDDRGNVHVHVCDPEWEAFEQLFKSIVAGGDPEVDWITIDPATITWDLVQSWWIASVHGDNIADHMAQARKEAADMKEYSATMAGDMTWPAVNKQYMEKFYRMYHAWRGHSVLICEPAELSRDADADTKSTYGFVGFKPKGQKTLPHVAATNVFLDHPRKDLWRMTTIKDRGRQLVEKQKVNEFAYDYLVEVAGWEEGFMKGSK